MLFGGVDGNKQLSITQCTQAKEPELLTDFLKEKKNIACYARYVEDFLICNFDFHDFSLSENCTSEYKKTKEASLFEPDTCNERTGKQKNFISAGSVLWKECTVHVNHDSHVHLRNTAGEKKFIRKEYVQAS